MIPLSSMTSPPSTGEPTVDSAAAYECGICGKTFDRKDLHGRHRRRCEKSSARPRKSKRRSCLHCAAAKLGCSLDRPACSRCLQRDVPCQYEEPSQDGRLVSGAIATSMLQSHGIGDGDGAYEAEVLRKLLATLGNDGAARLGSLLDAGVQNREREAVTSNEPDAFNLTPMETNTSPAPQHITTSEDQENRLSDPVEWSIPNDFDFADDSMLGFLLETAEVADQSGWTGTGTFVQGTSTVDAPTMRIGDTTSAHFSGSWDSTNDPTVLPKTTTSDIVNSDEAYGTINTHQQKRPLRTTGFSPHPSKGALDTGTTSGRLVEIIKGYPQMMISNGPHPPFIHSRIYRCHEGDVLEPLAKAFCFISAQNVAFPSSRGFVSRLMEEEQGHLIKSYASLAQDVDMLASLHAMIVYQILGFFGEIPEQVRTAEKHNSFLLKMARSLANKHRSQLLPSNAADNPLTTDWTDWILFETLRRTLFLIHVVNVLSTKTGQQNSFFYEPLDDDLILDMPLPAKGSLWRCVTGVEWSIARAELGDTGCTRSTVRERLEEIRNGQGEKDIEDEFTWLILETMKIIPR